MIIHTNKSSVFDLHLAFSIPLVEKQKGLQQIYSEKIFQQYADDPLAASCLLLMLIWIYGISTPKM